MKEYDEDRVSDFELVRVGFSASSEDAAVISSFGFDNDVYRFGTDCATGETPDGDADSSADESTDGSHDGDAPESPTPPEKVDTAAGDPNGIIFAGGILLAGLGAFALRAVAQRRTAKE